MSSAKYIVISPVRNEEQYLPQTIQCMAAQSVCPTEWILVDDGSTDSTGSIMDSAAAQHPWIKPTHRKNRGFRQAGGVDGDDGGVRSAEIVAVGEGLGVNLLGQSEAVRTGFGQTDQ